MQTINKHPDSVLDAVADFSERLRPEVTLQTIMEQPTLVGNDDGDLQLGTGAINTVAAVLLPADEAPVPIGAGVVFQVSGGTHRTRYVARLRVKTTDGEEIAKDLEINVGNDF